MDLSSSEVALKLNSILLQGGLRPVDESVAQRIAAYLALLQRWNARTNLTAIRDSDGILTRHFAESIACAQLIPDGIQKLLDFGSGAGFPGAVIAMCRPEISVHLAESQGKKAAFLRELVRVLGLGARVHGVRAESLSEQFDCVSIRAVDHMSRAVVSAAPLVSPQGLLAIMTIRRERGPIAVLLGAEFELGEPLPLPSGSERVLILGKRVL